MNFIIFLTSINIISFIICIIDKIKSIKKHYRISEDVLLFLSIIGGCFGMALGMNIIHPKTKKIKFKLVYIFCIIWIIVIYKLDLLFKWIRV